MTANTAETSLLAQSRAALADPAEGKMAPLEVEAVRRKSAGKKSAPDSASSTPTHRDGGPCSQCQEVGILRGDLQVVSVDI